MTIYVTGTYKTGLWTITLLLEGRLLPGQGKTLGQAIREARVNNEEQAESMFLGVQS
jgi:hypothetical protein